MEDKDFLHFLQDIRRDTLNLTRKEACSYFSEDLDEGKLEKIEELEQIILNVEGEFKNAIKGKPTIINNYQFNASTCII